MILNSDIVVQTSVNNDLIVIVAIRKDGFIVAITWQSIIFIVNILLSFFSLLLAGLGLPLLCKNIAETLQTEESASPEEAWRRASIWVILCLKVELIQVIRKVHSQPSLYFCVDLLNLNQMLIKVCKQSFLSIVWTH